MKKIWEEWFQTVHNGKVRERSMLVRITMSAVMIVMCMAAMSITAYAYFSTSITANISPVQSAVWRIAVEAEPDVVLDGEFYALDNREGTEPRVYQLTLSKAADATASHGYVKIDIKTDVDDYGALQTYYSQPMGKFLLNGSMTEDLDRDVAVTVPAGKLAYVKFTAEWGTCAKEPVIEESQGIVPMFAETADIEEITEPETTEEVTEPETTVPETTVPEAAAPETTVPETTLPETTQAATEPEPTEAPTEPETTEAEEPATTEAPTEPETTLEVTEPETTEEATEPEATEPETTEAPTEPETTQAVIEPEIAEAVTEPEVTEAATQATE